MEKTAVIEIEHLSKIFESKKVLKDVSLSINKGELFVLVGPDGSGKTTLLRILSSIYKPSSGKIRFHFQNKQIESNPEVLREKIGYMPQRFSLYEDLSVIENLNFFADMFLIQERERGKRVERLLEFSKLREFMDRPAGKLSGGMQKKLALSCTLIHEPKILLLDEPTNGVDPISRGELWDILYSLLERGKTILLTTPYMEEAEKAMNVGFLIKGKLTLVGKPEKLKSYLLNAVYTYVGEKAANIKQEVDKKYGISYFVGNRLRIVLSQKDSVTLLERFIRIKTRNFQLEGGKPSFEDIYLAYTKGILNVSH